MLNINDESLRNISTWRKHTRALLIKSIFAEEFQKQEKNIINIVSSKFEITMKERKDLKAEVSDLKDSLELQRMS